MNNCWRWNWCFIHPFQEKKKKKKGKLYISRNETWWWGKSHFLERASNILHHVVTGRYLVFSKAEQKVIYSKEVKISFKPLLKLSGSEDAWQEAIRTKMDKLLVMRKKVWHELLLPVSSRHWGTSEHDWWKLTFIQTLSPTDFVVPLGLGGNPAFLTSCRWAVPGHKHPASVWAQSVQTGIDMLSYGKGCTGSKKNTPQRNRWGKKALTGLQPSLLGQ